MTQSHRTSDELRSLLRRAELGDLDRIASCLDRWPRPAGIDAARRRAHADPPTADGRLLYEHVVANALEGAASSTIGSLARRALGRAPGADLHHVLTRTAKRLRVRVAPIGTLEGRLASLTSAVVDRAVLAMPPAEQQRILAEANVGPAASVYVPRLTKVAALPAVHHVLGAAVVTRVMEAIVAETVAIAIGREAARATVRAALLRAPWLAAALGPAAWIGSSAWLVIEVEGPAYRKVMPALLHLGLVAARRPA